MLFCIFGSQYSTQSKAFSVVCIVRYRNAVGFRVVAYAVNTWYFTSSDRSYREHVGRHWLC